MTDHNSTILLYGTSWCPQCSWVRKYLDRQNVKYRWFDITEDDSARMFVKSVNHGNESVPTIIWPDGSMLVEPSLPVLRSKLGL